MTPPRSYFPYSTLLVSLVLLSLSAMASSSRQNLPIRHHRRPQQLSSSSAPPFTKQSNLDSLTVPPLSPYPHPLQNPNARGDTEGKNPNSAGSVSAVTGLPPPAITPAPEDVFLSKSSHLTRQEVLRRRSHNLRQLTRLYKDHYWAMMEDLKVKYRDYVWKYGLSPFKVDEEWEAVKEEASNAGGEGSGDVCLEANTPCAFHGCTLKAMALTRFCHLHILSDPKQVLYKPCEYVIKSAQVGPITCGRPILGSRNPAFCNVHLQKAHRTLKKAGLHISSSSKLAPKFHVIVAESVHHIQAKRRATLKANRNNVVVKQESSN